MGPVLRSLAATPERAAEIDMNEGVLDIIEVKFPPKGTLVTPNFGKATGLRFFPLLRSLGIFAALLAKATSGRMPADHETIRIWGLHGGRIGHDFFLFREVLGGGGPGRPWADGSDVVHVVPNSRNLPAEFSETRYPVIIEPLGLATDSGGAGFRRGGLGYDKRVRVLGDCEALSNADRSLIHTYGVNGGMHGGNYALEMEDSAGGRRTLAGMDDRVPVGAGSAIRIRTNGGGGWGDPLAREPARVCHDVQCGLVSESAAHDDYGVVLVLRGRRYAVDEDGTGRLRERMRAERGPLPMFRRGPYFDDMKRRNAISRPEGLEDPDEGWFADGALPEAAQ